MEDIDSPEIVSVTCLASCLDTVGALGMHKGKSEQDSSDTKNIVKLIYTELLENRVHLLSDNEISYFESTFTRLYEQLGHKSIGFTPLFKDEVNRVKDG